MDISLQTHPSPLVSCIMPTRNRRPCVSQAIWYFLRQDYSHQELIILDDGEDQVDDLIPNDERIRYERLDRPLALGASTSPTRLLQHDITFQPLDLPKGVQQLLEDQDPRDRLTSTARHYCHDYCWQGTAERHSALWQSRETHH